MSGKRDSGKDFVYGRRPVTEAQRGRRRVRRVWTTDDLPPGELSRMAGSPDHQGIVAEVDPYPYADPRALLEHPDALVVALDQIQDPRNLGAVCRSAEAVGAAGVVIPSRRSASVTAAASKASAGAVEHLPIARVPNLADWLGFAKEAGAWVYGAQSGAKTPYASADLTGKVVIVLGGEGGGLRRRVAETCDLLVSIPMANDLESLNAGVAASVTLYSISQSRRSA